MSRRELSQKRGNVTKPRLGVVAVVPFWSQSDNLNADSNYSYLRIVLPRLAEATEDTVFLVFFPDPHYGNDKWVYTPDGLQNDRIRLIPWPYDTQMSSSVLGFDNMRFKFVEDNYGPTIYWLHQVESGTAIMGGYTNSYANTTRPVLIAQHHYVIHRSLPYVYDTQFPRQWFQIGGSIASDAIVYNSDHCRKMADESFAEYLNPDMMSVLDRKSSVLKFGLLRGDEPIAPEATTQEPVFIYNHRFEYYKRPDLTFGMFDRLRPDYHFQVWATQTSGQMTGGKKGYTYDRSVFAPSRAQYLQNIAVPAINTINSVHETFCISAMDSLALGHLLVAPRAITFPELVPPDYPYLFNNEKEQEAMIRGILGTWPTEYNKWRGILSSYVREKFSLNQYVDDYLTLMMKEEQAHREANRKDHILAALRDVFDSFKPGEFYPPNDVRRAVVRVLTQRDHGVGGQSMPTRRIVREAIALREDVAITWTQGGVRLSRKT